jgi:hypothetical protein
MSQQRERRAPVVTAGHRQSGRSGQHDWLVAVFAGIVVRTDQTGIASSRPMAAGEDAHRPATGGEFAGEFGHQRGLAGSADHQIADHHHQRSFARRQTSQHGATAACLTGYPA